MKRAWIALFAGAGGALAYFTTRYVLYGGDDRLVTVRGGRWWDAIDKPPVVVATFVAAAIVGAGLWLAERSRQN